MIIDIARELLNLQQIWDLTRGLGNQDYIRADYAGIWQLLIDQLGAPELVKYHAWCTLPEVFYQQIMEHPKRHNISPQLDLELVDGKPTICISNIGGGLRKNLATFQNWSWLQKWAKAVVSHVINLPENAIFQLLRKPSYRSGMLARIADKRGDEPKQLYCELPNLQSLRFRTPPDMIGEFHLQFQEVVIRIELMREALEITFVDKSIGSIAWDLAENLACRFPRVRVNYEIGSHKFSYKVLLNKSWQEGKDIDDPPIFLLPDQKTDDPLLWAAKLYAEASRNLASGNIEESQAKVQELKDRVAVLNRSLAGGEFQFPFIEIKEGKLTVQDEDGHCKFCGNQTDKDSVMIPTGFLDIYEFFTFCDDPLCQDAFKQYCSNYRESLQKHGPVSLFGAFNGAFRKAFSLRQRLFGPIKDSTKALWRKTWQKRKSEKSAEKVSEVEFKLEPFSFTPLEYKYEEPVIPESMKKKADEVRFPQQNIHLALFANLITAIIVLACLVGTQVIIWQNWSNYFVVVPLLFWIVSVGYLNAITNCTKIINYCTNLLKIKKSTSFIILFNDICFSMLIAKLLVNVLNLNISIWLTFFALTIFFNTIINQIHLFRAKKKLKSMEK